MCRLLRLFRKVKLIFFPLVKSIAKGVYLKLLNYLYNYILIKQNMILVIFPQFSVHGYTLKLRAKFPKSNIVYAGKSSRLFTVVY